MRILLDTHSFLWFLQKSPNFPSELITTIEKPGSETFVSIASFWEIVIKVSLKKLSLPPGHEDLSGAARSSNITLLPIEPRHLDVLRSLPFHHKDPFDRLLIAQAISEKLIIATIDSEFSHYAADLIWDIQRS
jgi:PIN domain nuclease of toxin-antitoxin system